MSRDLSDEELSRIREETALRRKQLEELQMEELRRIRELERQKNSGTAAGYSPELDSAFVQDPQTAYQQQLQQQQLQQQQLQYQQQLQQQQLQQQMQQQQVQAPQFQQQPHQQAQPQRQRPTNQQAQQQRQRPTQQTQDRARRRQQAERYEEPRPRKRMYDPDQLVSDEDYEESYEDDYRREKRQKNSSSKKSKKNGGFTTGKPQKKKKKRHPFRTLIAILLVILLIFGLLVWNVTRKFNHIDTEVGSRADSMKHQTINILLIGQDARDGQTDQRSDTMIILSINQKKNTACMVSIMRDTYVQIPGYGGNRINAAYAYGGIDLLDQTIEENFDITIDGNMMVDFDGFLEAMTAVGSLKMDLTAEEAEYMNANPALGSNNDESDEVWDLTEGENKLTPSQILCYSRMRYVGNSDWDRTERQRKVISGVTSQVKHGHLIKGYKVANKAAPSMTTDMKTFGMMRVASGVMTSGDMESYLIPAENTYYADTVDGMAVLVPDLEANKALLKQYISGEYEADSETE